MSRLNPELRPPRSHRGVTVLEVLIALGLLVVLLSFASPSLSGAAARAEMKAAAENMDLSIRMARNTARQLQTTVVMHLHTDRKARRHTVTYTVPGLQLNAPETATLIDYQLPESVRIEASDPIVRFDFRGVAEKPVQVALVSLHDDDLNHRILVE